MMTPTAVAAGITIGPATVVRTDDGVVELAGPHGQMKAELALAFPYSPCVGDIVLVFGETEFYVIGVLRGKGSSTITLPGDGEIRAEGRLRIVSPQSVHTESPSVTVRADRFEITARAIFERTLDAYRWVKNAIQTTAGRMRTLVAGTSETRAERVQQIAQKDVRIDGERINIG